MDSLVHTLLSNALAATFMAVIAMALARMCRRPALTHSVWLLVMLKLVTPPFVTVSLPIASVIPLIESSPARLPFDRDAGLHHEQRASCTFKCRRLWPGRTVEQIRLKRRDVNSLKLSRISPIGRAASQELVFEETPCLPGRSLAGTGNHRSSCSSWREHSAGGRLRRPGSSAFSTSSRAYSRQRGSGNCIPIELAEQSGSELATVVMPGTRSCTADALGDRQPATAVGTGETLDEDGRR